MFYVYEDYLHETIIPCEDKQNFIKGISLVFQTFSTFPSKGKHFYYSTSFTFQFYFMINSKIGV